MRRLLPMLLAATFAGCGPPKPVRARDHVVSITITDFRLHPQDVRVPKGRITFKVRNIGHLPHNFAIRGLGRQRLQVSTMLPGESDQGAVTLPAGNFRMFCSIANHEKLGEYGTLVVR